MKNRRGKDDGKGKSHFDPRTKAWKGKKNLKKGEGLISLSGTWRKRELEKTLLIRSPEEENGRSGGS